MKNAKPVEALGTKAMSEGAQFTNRAQEARIRSASSYQERKSAQADSSRRATWSAIACAAQRGSWPKVAVFRKVQCKRAGNSARIFDQLIILHPTANAWLHSFAMRKI